MPRTARYYLGVGILLAPLVGIGLHQLVYLALHPGSLVEAVGVLITPVIYLLALAYVGWLLARLPVSESGPLRIGYWAVSGTIVFTAAQLVSVQHLNVYGVDPASFRFSLGGWALGGGAVGLLVGAYDLRQQVALRELGDAKQEAERREKRISILNRVLRHDVRNGTMVILGYLDEIERETGSTDAVQTIRARAEGLNRVAERARDVEEVFRLEETQPVDVADCVSERATALSREYPTASVTVDTPETARADTVPQLCAALDGVIENGIVHNTSSTPTVQVDVRRDPGGDVTVNVADDGPGFPEPEKEILTRGEETPLRHSGGTGLWFLKWVIERSDGELAIEESDLGGTRVSVTLPGASPDATVRST